MTSMGAFGIFTGRCPLIIRSIKQKINYISMPITTELTQAITADLIQAYRHKFGETWAENLTKNLRPSPNEEIARRHGVSKKVVVEIKHEIWKVGIAMRLLRDAEV